ncbi:response regulator receiver domain-containing protein [Vibrio crassostreae]|uniref:response regulator n=1 Tax=Vibrio crassostreae TaxID=246167 RepID=UPI000F4665CF|nr:response regulator [Vibrio crassostreae]ROO75908.1 response regulator receiver domain-containing protein [Vibrio crassostreae]ROP13915.1 response regulator receiver domain-containing protein [Vibrio crassostreae]RPE94847.1 response regulator receiver domain-containing protein [Vibrio crassostreae]RPF17586.1 response regulator receiver domain-containing protein [Vibrio crassostreae]
MIKVLIVDDNKLRINKLKKAIGKLSNQEYLKIDEAMCASSAKKLMRITKYDLLVLDVVLPRRKGDTPQASEGIKTLRDIHDKDAYFSPTKVIGITAFIADMGKFSDEFHDRTSIILEATANSSSWVSRISNNVDSLIKTFVSEARSHASVSLITIHGIRTTGKWQDTLEKLVKENSREVENMPLKYGFFSLISFLIPSLRNYVSKKIETKIHSVLDQSKHEKVILVAHSFGTYIAAKAIQSYSGKSKLDLVIFAGSVLKTDYDIEKIQSKTSTFINECGGKDKILMFCNMLVLGLGDAGRTGFITPQSNSFINRYYDGGHSVYLTENSMLENWIPPIISEKEISAFDNRENRWYQDVTEFVIQLVSRFKPLIYIGLLYAVYRATVV